MAGLDHICECRLIKFRGRSPVATVKLSMRSAFKDQYPFEQRKAKAEALRQQHSDRVPIICERLVSSDLPDITTKRFIVPSDFTVGNFMTVVRNRIKVGPEKTLFIFVNNTLLPMNALLSVVYQQHSDADGFLYLIYSSENSFGGSFSISG